jgi:hypothetical protein
LSELKEVLRRNFEGPRKLGAGDEKPLVSDLGRLERDLQRTWWVRIAMIAAVFVVELILFVIYRENTAAVAALFAAAGITIGGAITSVQGVTQEMTRVRLLLSVVPSLSPETLQELARKLIEKL